MIGKPIYKPLYEYNSSHRADIFGRPVYYWFELSRNPDALPILEDNVNLLDWEALSANPAAVHLLNKQKPNKINWSELSANPSSEAMKLLEANPDRINWYRLCGNPYAMKIIKNNINDKISNKNKMKIIWSQLSRNPAPEAIELLRKNRHEIDCSQLSHNPSPDAIELMKGKIDKVTWITQEMQLDKIRKEKMNKIRRTPTPVEKLTDPLLKKIISEQIADNNLSADACGTSGKSNTYNGCINNDTYERTHKHYMNTQLEHIPWDYISLNPLAIELIKENQQHINWFYISSNSAPYAVQLIMENQDKINWDRLALNESPIALQLLEQNLSKINWEMLSQNTSPHAMKIIEEQINSASDVKNYYNGLSHCCWLHLSRNPAAFDILIKNIDIVIKSYGSYLCSNPNVLRLLFRLNTVAMRNTMQPFAEELAQRVFYPKRLARQAEQCGVQVWELLEMYE